jgi:hypothetical protein
MQKPSSLRAALEKAIPELKRAPEKMQLFTKTGKVAARWHPEKLSWDYDYTLSITILDFSQAPDTVFLSILAWMTVHQVDKLQNHGTADSAITFDVDMIDAKTIDIAIELKLTETIDVVPNGNGKFVMKTRKEPAPIGFEKIESFPDLPCGVRLRAVYDQAGTLILPDDVTADE